MINAKLVFSRSILCLFLLSFLFTSCEKDSIVNPEINDWDKKGLQKKDIVLQGENGDIELHIQVTADQQVLDLFNKTSLTIESVLELDQTTDENSTYESDVEEDHNDIAEEEEEEADYEYYVNIISKKTKGGTQGIKLNVNLSDNTSDFQNMNKACQTFFGYYTNSTSAIGVAVNDRNCPSSFRAKFYYFVQGNPNLFTSFGSSSWSTYSLHNWCHGSPHHLEAVHLNMNCTLRRYASEDGLHRITRNIFSHNDGFAVGMKVNQGFCQNNVFGIFIF